MVRARRSYIYLGILAIGVALLNLLARQADLAHPDNPLQVLYLCMAAALLNIPHVRIERGRLTLIGIANVAAALLLNPIDATAVGLASSASVVRRGSYPVLGNAVFSATLNCLGSIVAAEVRTGGSLPVSARILTILTCIASNLALVILGFRIRFGEPVQNVTRQTFTASF